MGEAGDWGMGQWGGSRGGEGLDEGKYNKPK